MRLGGRSFEPGVYQGTRVSFNTKAERDALVGKRIGYDRRGSSLLYFGRVEQALGRELVVDGDYLDIASLEQVVVLDDQQGPVPSQDAEPSS